MNHYPFHVIIKPVGDTCNLNCTYCFYKDKSTDNDKVMDFHTLERITQLYISQQPLGCKEVQFVWQGGEPMLAGLDFYQAAVAMQNKYRRENMAITNAIQTNGTLISKKWSAFFNKHQFLVGISIDGTEGNHDAQRIYYSGAPSHSNVLRGLEHLKEHQVAYNVLSVVHQGNVKEAESTYRYLTNLGAQSIQYLPDTENNLVASDWGRFLTRTFDAWLEDGVGTTTIQLFDASFTKIHTNFETFCVHAKRCGHQLAVERNGDVFSCDHFVSQDHKLGSILDKDFVALMNDGQQEAFATDTQRTHANCETCHVRGLCQGGCPKHRDPAGLNSLCGGYKPFFTYAAPYFLAMSECLKRKISPTKYKQFLPFAKVAVSS